MINRLMAYWLFFPLGLLFMLTNFNFEDTTLLCVYYSFYAGAIWTLIPQLAQVQLPWMHLLPPFLLVILMMMGARLKMIMSTETVVLTAVALIHLRACILAFARVPNQLRVFKWVQFSLFILSLSYIFQNRILTTPLPRPYFLIFLGVMGTFSVSLLFQASMAQKKVA